MKIIVDDKIPYIREKLLLLADEVVALRGADINANDVRDADALIVRTRTRCDETLLHGSCVQLVATATIGYDHLDTAYLERAGIAWTNCPGCNSGSVAQYVESSLLLLERMKGLRLSQSVLGIVGCGHVGSKVKAVAERLGMRTLVCDPPLAQQEAAVTPHSSLITDFPSLMPHPSSLIPFTSMDVIEQEADVITFHVPLTLEGRYATRHMADAAFFSRLARKPYIINTSRGEVVDNEALLRALNDGEVCDAIVDVWENEPDINLDLLQRVFIGTPHIAGYSADGKVNADNMVIDALCRHFDLPHPGRIVPPSLPNGMCPNGDPLGLYDPRRDSEALKKAPGSFEFLRNNYPIRRERCQA